MNCMNCGARLREGDKFCLSCGSPIPEMPAQAPPCPAPVGSPVAPTGSPILILPVVFSVIGALMLLIGDFGGWYNYDYYHGIRTWGWINAGTAAIVLLLPMAILMFFAAFASIQAFRSDIYTARKLTQRGFIASLVVFIIVIIGGVALIAATWENTSNWLDVGFYGGLFGSLISAIILGYESRRLGRMLGPAPAMPYGPPVAPPPYGQPPQAAPQPPPQPAPPPQPVQPQCRNCGAPIEPGTKFCIICGAHQ